MVNIVLFGAPGAGKGTQAEKIIDKYGIKHISTGAVIRDEIASGSELGKSVEEYIARGEFAPDALVIDMVSDYLKSHGNCRGNIFDGFPRNTVQAAEFDKMMEQNGMNVDVMISLEVPERELIRRLLHRGLSSGRADDANEEVIRRRIEIYNETTAVVAKYYAAQGKHVKVDGTGTMDEIFERISEVIDRYISRQKVAV